jgi:hypothetical protein
VHTQDRSKLALIEISQQGAIFSDAASVVAWLNHVETWHIMQDVLTWLGLFCLHTSVAIEDGEYVVPGLPSPEGSISERMELDDWTSGILAALTFEQAAQGLKAAAPAAWITSLWTLQEAYLRPGPALYNKRWEPLAIRRDELVTFDQPVALDNLALEVNSQNRP